jgi:SAM-dependent methyltransferase
VTAVPTAPATHAARSDIASNRAFYDALWSSSYVVSPQRFNTWPLLSALAASATARLEIGPGLHPRLPIAGTHFVDISAPALSSLKARAGLTTLGDITALPFPDRTFDLVCAFDIIEHVEDDAAFVAATVRDLLRDDGYALVSVPAYQALWSSHDRALRHHRRYSPADCRRLLERAGLVVISGGGLFVSLLPARIGELLIERVRPVASAASGVGDWSGGPVLTAALSRLLSVDGRMSLALSERGVSVPGLSYWALCGPSGG